MKDMLLLGIVALVAVVVLVLFMTGELKNKSTFSSDGHVNHQGTEIARSSLELNDLGKGLFEQLYGDIHLGKGQGIVDPLYAQGGGYDTYQVPYGKDEDLHYLSNKAQLTDADWAADYEIESSKEKVDEERLTRLAANQHYYAPYTHKDSFVKTQKHMRHLDKKWAHDEENKLHVLASAHSPHHGVVSNRHTRHPASAGH